MEIDQNGLGVLTLTLGAAAYVATYSVVIQQKRGEQRRELSDLAITDVDKRPKLVASIGRKQFRLWMLMIAEAPLIVASLYLAFCVLVWDPRWPRLYWPERVVRWLIVFSATWLCILHIVAWGSRAFRKSP